MGQPFPYTCTFLLVRQICSELSSYHVLPKHVKCASIKKKIINVNVHFSLANPCLPHSFGLQRITPACTCVCQLRIIASNVAFYICIHCGVKALKGTANFCFRCGNKLVQHHYESMRQLPKCNLCQRELQSGQPIFDNCRVESVDSKEIMSKPSEQDEVSSRFARCMPLLP